MSSSQEPSSELSEERVVFTGVLIALFLFGVHFTLFVSLIYPIWRRRRARPLQTYFFVGYITVMFAMGLLYVVALGNNAQRGWIDHRDDAGGPLATFYSLGTQDADIGVVLTSISTCLAEGLLLWRCWVVWTGCRFRWLLVLAPGLTLIAYFVLSVFSILSHTSSNSFLNNVISIPSLAIALTTNMTTTSLISLRLYLQKRQVSILGKAYISTYNFIMEVIVESAAVYTAVTLGFLVTVILNSDVQGVFIFAFCESAMICSLLIIYRLTKPDSDTNGATRTGVKSMRFAANPGLPVDTTTTSIRVPISELNSEDETKIGPGSAGKVESQKSRSDLEAGIYDGGSSTSSFPKH